MNGKIKYPFLPEGREIKYVESDNKFMQAAQEATENLSTEKRFSTGAVVVKNGEVLGKNGNQSRLKNKKLKSLHDEKKICIRRLLGVKSGNLYGLCPGCSSPYDHAEQTAIKDAIKNKKNTEGADLYLYGHWWCCESCWQAMIKAGIKDVYLLKNSGFLFNESNKK